MRKWWAWLGIILTAGMEAGAVHAEDRGGTIRSGVLNDQSDVYADIAVPPPFGSRGKRSKISAPPPRA
jgi:hypothetical protein